jgi:hypothetical protein
MSRLPHFATFYAFFLTNAVLMTAVKNLTACLSAGFSKAFGLCALVIDATLPR